MTTVDGRAYKSVVTRVVARSTHLQRLFLTDRTAPLVRVPQGVVIETATDVHLFGTSK